MDVLDWLLSILTGLIAIQVAFLFFETLAASFPLRSRARSRNPRLSAAIVIPAHNEELGIVATLRRLQEELQPGDRVLVVADNCNDSTAHLAREFGVGVLERTNDLNRGKGFAIEAGIGNLSSDPPDFVVILDADCRFVPGSLNHLLGAAESSGVPTQAIYLPGVRDDGSFKSKWATFALRFKNEARPVGLYRLGLPCLLTGSGIALSWNAIQSVSWGTGSIVEDMRVGVDLAIAEHPPQLCPHSQVISDAPPTDHASLKQRTRWEHGHVSTLLTQAPRLLLYALWQCRPRLIFLALELSVPPLSLLVLGLIAFTGLSWLNWQFREGSEIPLLENLLGWATLSLTIFLAWCKYGRGIVPIRSLLLLPLYILWKLPIYLKLIGRRERNWIRTDRANS